MSRVIAYVDGFNLYFGLRSKRWQKYYWLHLSNLAKSILKPGQHLEFLYYFTSRIRSNGRNVDDIQRQNTYLEALEALPGIEIKHGHYLEKPRRCWQCGAQWLDYEEKMTDVNIAVQLLTDAFSDRFDTALLISGDSDLTTPVKTLRTQFPGKRLIVAFPPGRQSSELKKAANGYLHIGEDKLRQSQLPPEVSRADGFVLKRPEHWK